MKPRELILQWVDAFNSTDAKKIAALYDSNAINHKVYTDPVVGRDQIEKMFAAVVASASMVCIIENIFEDGNWGILEWKDPLGLRGCGFFQFDNNLIVFQRGYFDRLSFLRQQKLPLPKE